MPAVHGPHRRVRAADDPGLGLHPLERRVRVNLSASVHLGVDGFSITGTLAAGASLYIESTGRLPLPLLRPGAVDVELFGIGIGGSIELSGEAFLGATNSFLRLRLTGLRRPLLLRRLRVDDDRRDPAAEHDLPATAPEACPVPDRDSGALELNVGANASRRTVVPTTTAEDYRVTQVSFDAYHRLLHRAGRGLRLQRGVQQGHAASPATSAPTTTRSCSSRAPACR